MKVYSTKSRHSCHAFRLMLRDSEGIETTVKRTGTGRYVVYTKRDDLDPQVVRTAAKVAKDELAVWGL